MSAEDLAEEITQTGSTLFRLLGRFLRTLKSAPEDRLLTADEAATRLGCSKNYLYRNSKKLPFAVKLTEKRVRFSTRGIDKYLALRQNRSTE
jgi:predicted DNA-binding transcriptional regulator AlpA